MSAPNYDMSTVWNDQYVAPQLEQEEYPLDATMYTDLHPAQSTSYHRRPDPTPSQNGSFSSFGSSFSQGIPEFNFTGPQMHGGPPEGGQQPNGSDFLVPPAAPSQARGRFGTANPLYVGTSSPHHVDQLGLSPNIPGAYPVYQQPPQRIRSSPSGAAQPQLPFDRPDDEMYGAGASPLFHSAFSTHPVQMGAGQGMRPAYIGGVQQQDMFNKPLFKRPREEGPGFDPDNDLDGEETAINKDATKPKA